MQDCLSRFAHALESKEATGIETTIGILDF